MVTNICIVLLSLSLLLLNLQVFRVSRRLRVCEDRHAAIDLLADQVLDLSSDFYGPIK